MPPRGRPPVDKPRSNALHIRVTDDDLSAIKRAAELVAAQTGKPKSVGDYVRDAAVAKAKRAK